MEIKIRPSRVGDEHTIVALMRELALEGGTTSPVTDQEIRTFLDTGANGALLAESGDEVVAALTYSVHPGIFHGGTWALIEELIVTAKARGHGAGHALMDEALKAFVELGCREASVSTEFDNEVAKRLYRAHGFVDESLLLERHF
jgi:ribosomal protein S18 acetylase RimI-like enzyme